MNIPTYIIVNKLNNIIADELLKKSAHREEFDIELIEVVSQKEPIAGIWEAIKNTVRHLSNQECEFVLFCIDDICLSKEYSTSVLRIAIQQAIAEGADVILGKVSACEYLFFFTDQLLWVEKTVGEQFVIILRKYFSTILKTDFTTCKNSGFEKLVSAKKVLIHPFLVNEEKVISIKNKELDWDIRMLKQIRHHYSTIRYLTPPATGINNVVIPVYVINLKERLDRRKHIMNQFSNKIEFDLNIVEACKHQTGAVGLWMSIRKIVELAIEKDEDLIIVCEDDHQFTKHYNRYSFIRTILEAYQRGCDILAGGICKTKYVIPLTKELYWISSFWGTQFFVIYRKMYSKILQETFNSTDAADDKISAMTSHKMVIYPFISVQKEFGYSDVTIENNTPGLVSQIFKETGKKMKVYQNLYKRYLGE